MPIAYKCSRCGSYYDNNEHAYLHQTDRYRLYQTSEIFDDRRVDLCLACHDRFNDLISDWFEPEQVMMKPVIVDKPEAGKKKGWWKK